MSFKQNVTQHTYLSLLFENYRGNNNLYFDIRKNKSYYEIYNIQLTIESYNNDFIAESDNIVKYDSVNNIILEDVVLSSDEKFSDIIKDIFTNVPEVAGG
jgi:hypothetical protein